MDEDRNETGAQREQRIQGEAVAAEIARKQAEGEELTQDEQDSLDVQAAKDLAAEEEARQAAIEGTANAAPEDVVGQNGQTPGESSDHTDPTGNPEGSSGGQQPD